MVCDVTTLNIGHILPKTKIIQMKTVMFLKGQSFSRKLTMCFCVVPAVQYSNMDYEKEKKLVFVHELAHELRSVEDFLYILLLKIRALFRFSQKRTSVKE